MSRPTFEQLRLPVGLVLVLVAAFVFLPRGDDADPAAEAASSPSPSVIAGQPVGEVLPGPSGPSPSPSQSPTPSGTPAPSPSPDDQETASSPEPTPQPADDGFTARVLVCRSNTNEVCNGEISNLPPSADTFTALVLFTDANQGDEIRAITDGPGGSRDGGAYALQGGGNGWYYSTFAAGDLEPGEYTVTAFRNGEEVASTSFRRVGN